MKSHLFQPPTPIGPTLRPVPEDYFRSFVLAARSRFFEIARGPTYHRCRLILHRVDSINSECVRSLARNPRTSVSYFPRVRSLVTFSGSYFRAKLPRNRDVAQFVRRSRFSLNFPTPTTPRGNNESCELSGESRAMDLLLPILNQSRVPGVPRFIQSDSRVVCTIRRRMGKVSTNVTQTCVASVLCRWMRSILM